MKLSQWAKKNGISYTTAYSWFKNGNLPVPAIQTNTGTILIQNEDIVNSQSNQAFIYCRVSSSNKKDDLNRQASRCEEFCTNSGFEIMGVTKEIASGMNDIRPKLFKLLEKKPKILVVEHKDRLTRFGFNYFEYFLKQLGCRLIVINRDSEETDDLMKDLVAIITSFCCRLYGMRRGLNKQKKMKEALDDPNI